MYSAGRALALLALAIVGAGSWWWLSKQREEAVTVEAPRHPDSYFQEFDVVRHNADGDPELRVNAEYAEHFENEPWIHLRDLDATGLAGGPAWRLRANEGRLTDDGVHLEAQGEVVLSRTGQKNGDMELHTEHLSVNTETRIAATDEHVTIMQGSGNISGRGMWASLADDRLRLESEVRARYEK